ncbi:MAG TPA: CDP-alcohol phosphatidyltransferase family protein [Limnochorda sp.]
MANLLTLIRILLIPLFLILVVGKPVPGWQGWGLGVLALSAATDVADGWVARRRGEVSPFGTLADPLADKLTLVAVLVALAWEGLVPWWVAVLLLGKETVQVAGAAWLWRRRDRVVTARWPGKAATVVLYLGAVLVLLGWGPGGAIVAAGVLLSLAAGVYYLVLALRAGKPTIGGPA